MWQVGDMCEHSALWEVMLMLCHTQAVLRIQVGTITRASTLWELPSTDVPLGAVARKGITKVEIAADATPIVASRVNQVALYVRHIVRRTCDDRSGVLQV